MLIGEYKHTIDTKKRLSLPAKFRKELGKTIVITRGIDNCLAVYPEKEWKIVSEKLSQLPDSRVEARSFSRIILSGAMEVNIDKLGRILIPDYLKTYAGLKKNTAVIGRFNRLEIWDENKWETYKNGVKVSSVVSKLEDQGI